jgi:hypothetical protein
MKRHRWDYRDRYARSMNRLQRWYGAHVLHLLAMAGCFALAGYAAVQLLAGRTLAVALWFLGAALLHDLILLPAYTGADRGAQALLHTRTSPIAPDAPPHGKRRPAAPPVINYVRVPTFLSGLFLLVWFPLILNSSGPYPGATGLTETPYLGRWLLITASLYTAAAALLALRLLRHRLPRRPGFARRRRALTAPKPADPGR